MEYKAGQRWFSQAEPELGLGVVTQTDRDRVTLVFAALETERVYATHNAPLQRFAPEPGQSVTDQSGVTITVEEVVRVEDLRVYAGFDVTGQWHEIPESKLGPELSLDEAGDRLLSGQVNRLEWYNLRQRLMHSLARHRASPAFGLTGGRIDRLPHQLSVAWRATEFGLPRAMLSDEVGLGKTIEAGMILHRLRALGHARRILIHVPESLQNQWLAELIRKFDLFPRVLNADQWEAEMDDNPLGNPFESAQCVLVTDALWNRTTAGQQVQETEWDLLIVDEAHQWHPESGRSVDGILSALVRSVPGVLLLTATPERGGAREAFARLHGLDPERFADFESWQSNEQRLAALGDQLTQWLENPGRDTAFFTHWLSDDPHGQALATEVAERPGDNTRLQALADHLLEVHASGRVQFRHMRSETAGFPERRVKAIPLPCPPGYDPDDPCPERTVEEESRVAEDPRAEWLSGLLREDRSQKVLVICRFAETARHLADYLMLRQGLTAAAFHEDLELLARDRAAAWFADPVDGAQALICSEIGSEGRNFQFAHTLVCFDLPAQPGLLEQRIGRLDRIGQTRPVRIRVPVLENHVSELWFRWYDQALNAFREVCTVGQDVLDQAVEDSGSEPDLNRLGLTAENIDERIRKDAEVATTLKETERTGRQRLLSWASGGTEESRRLPAAIAREEAENSPESWVLECLDRFGYEIDDSGSDLYIVSPGSEQIPEDFPLGRPGSDADQDQAVSITFDRSVAVHRDDVQLITWEHPLIDFLVDSLDQLHLGRAGITLIRLPNVQAGQLFLEALYRPEIRHPAASRLAPHLDMTLIRRVCDSQGKDLSRVFAGVNWRDLQRPLDRKTLMAIVKSQQSAIRELIRYNQDLAEPESGQRQARAHDNLQASLDLALNDLSLREQRTGRLLPDRRAWLEEETRQLTQALEQTNWQQDSLRLIVTS